MTKTAWRTALVRTRRGARSVLTALQRAVAGIDGGDVLLVVGLILVTCGLWDISRPAALVTVGAVLIWIALPPRSPFLRG